MVTVSLHFFTTAKKRLNTGFSGKNYFRSRRSIFRFFRKAKGQRGNLPGKKYFSLYYYLPQKSGFGTKKMLHFHYIFCYARKNRINTGFSVKRYFHSRASFPVSCRAFCPEKYLSLYYYLAQKRGFGEKNLLQFRYIFRNIQKSP